MKFLETLLSKKNLTPGVNSEARLANSEEKHRSQHVLFEK